MRLHEYAVPTHIIIPAPASKTIQRSDFRLSGCDITRSISLAS